MQGRPKIALAALVLHALTVAACDGAGPDDAALASAFVMRDSATIRIVESAAPLWADGEGWTIPSELAVQIGALEGEAPYQFTRIGWSALFVDERVVVSDAADLEIRVFDTSGRHLATMGRRGGGPGEFNVTPVLGFTPPDTLLAFDGRRRHYARFTLNGRFIDDRSLGGELEARGLTRWAPASVRSLVADGSFVLSEGGAIGLPRPPVAEVDSSLPTLWAVRDWGERVVRIAELQTGELGHQEMERASNPFFPIHAQALGADPPAIHVAGPGIAELRTYALDGGLQRIARAGIPRVPLTSELIDLERQALLTVAEEGGRDVASRRASFDALTFPDSAPAIVRVYPAASGGVWTRRWSHPRQANAPAVYDVFDAEGRWLGPVELPADAGELQAIGTEHLLTVWTDELDVPYLRLYRIERPDDG